MKAIDTEYKGYLFRSRLEARWAVFFDACGVKWEYEPEGFDLGDGIYYLPDFLLHDVIIRYNQGNHVKNLWVEVKGKMTDADIIKIEKFSRIPVDENGHFLSYWSQNPLLILRDIPEEDYYHSIMNLFYIVGWKKFFSFEYIDGDTFPAVPCITSTGKLALAGGDGNYHVNVDKKKTVAAYKLARQARFEHGQTPLIRR